MLLKSFFAEFIHLLEESTPWFLLGAVLGASLNTWMPKKWSNYWLLGGKRSIFAATILGAILPGCAISTMPIAEGLKERGARLGSLAAFIMVAPLLSPHTVLFSWAMLGWKMTLLRVMISLFLASALGLLLNWLEVHFASFFLVPRAKNSASWAKSCCCATSENIDLVEKVDFFHALAKILRELCWYFVGGLAVAALLSAMLPPDWASSHLRGGIFAYLMAIVVGVPLYVCDGGEVPLTLALLKTGVGSGPAFAFMLSSVGTCFATMVMASRMIGICATALCVAGTFVAAVGGGLLLEHWIKF